MGELRALWCLMCEWNCHRSHNFGVYPFSEEFDMLCHRYFDCPRRCAIALRDVMQFSVSLCASIVIGMEKPQSYPRPHYEINLSPSWISYVIISFVYVL